MRCVQRRADGERGGGYSGGARTEVVVLEMSVGNHAEVTRIRSGRTVGRRSRACGVSTRILHTLRRVHVCRSWYRATPSVITMSAAESARLPFDAAHICESQYEIIGCAPLYVGVHGNVYIVVVARDGAIVDVTDDDTVRRAKDRMLARSVSRLQVQWETAARATWDTLTRAEQDTKIATNVNRIRRRIAKSPDAYLPFVFDDVRSRTHSSWSTLTSQWREHTHRALARPRPRHADTPVVPVESTSTTVRVSKRKRVRHTLARGLISRIRS